MARPSATSERLAPALGGDGRRNAGRQRGAIYLFLLFVVAVVGAGLASLGRSWAQDAQRARETELLWVGAAYREAIGRYYEATPGRAKTYPASLDSLLLDPRFPDTRRHLRQLMPDPMTGQADWILIPAPGGGVMGVASRSEDKPLKQTGFEPPNRVFEDVSAQLKEQMRYRDWEFVYSPRAG